MLNCTYLKYKIWSVLTSVHNCEPSPLRPTCFLILMHDASSPLSCSSPRSSPHPVPRHLLFCFLSPWITFYFLEFYINEIIQYELFLGCVWLLLHSIIILRCIHIACVDSPFLVLNIAGHCLNRLPFVYSFNS